MMINTLLRTLFFILFMLFTQQALAISINSNVDRTTINENETLLLTVTVDKQGVNNIDFSAINLQFDILQRQRSSQTSIVNGKITAKTQWTLVLSPKETGDLVIPSLTAMGAYSDAIKIRVNKTNQTSNHSPSTTGEAIFLKASVDKQSIYVQEQLLFTLRLYYRVSLSGYTPTEINIDNASIEKASESNYQTTLDGMTYNVLEQVYSIHPQASGTLVIPAQRWQVEKANNRFGFGRITSPYLKLSSQQQQVVVKAVPSTSTASHWLPAKSIVLTQDWQQSTVTAKIGEPITYSLTIKADGLSHSQLPTITKQNTDQFTIYADQAKTDNTLSNSGITGTRVENYAIIPKTTGKHQLTGTTLTWWNVETDQEETITLPPTTIIVGQSDINEQLPKTTINTPAPVTINNIAPKQHGLWKALTLFFALLSLLFFVLWRRKNNPEKNQPPIKTKQEAPSLNQMYKKIDHAIDTKEFLSLKSLIKDWASIKTQTSITNTSEVIKHFPELKETLDSLDSYLYSNQKNIIINTSSLSTTLKKQQQTHKKNATKNTLKKLY